MLAKDLLKKVRFSLSDTEVSRWSDDRLISLLNDCISNITLKTIIFVNEAYIKLVNGKVDYDLSDIAVKIIRVEFEKKPLVFKSLADMDGKNSTWQNDEGSRIIYVIPDKRREANFKLYPILKNTAVTLSDNNVNYSGSYGIVTGISYTDIPLVIADDFGDISPIPADGYIKVFYIKRHAEITDINDTLDLSSVAQELAQHFIVGKALRDNQDTQSRTLAKEELDMYNNQLVDYSFEKAKNFTQASHQVKYNSMG